MTLRVLIVDDEEDVRLALRTLLEEEVDGIQVATAGGGDEALSLVETNTFDLMLVDYRMPGMDGLAFIEEVKKRHDPIPSLLLTAYPDPQLAARAVSEVGVGLLVAKPMDLDYFVAIVRALLADPAAADRISRVFSP